MTDNKKFKLKIKELENSNRTFADIFRCIFSNEDSIMFSLYVDGKKINYSYGEIKTAAFNFSKVISEQIGNDNKDTWVAINAENKVIWTILFWAALCAGYKPFLLNPNHTIENNKHNLELLNIKHVLGDSPFENVSFIKLSLDDNSLFTKKEEIVYDHFNDQMAFSSSGSSSKPKIAVYSGTKIVEDLRNFVHVSKMDKGFCRHHKKQHCQLVTLPFYHVFGFMLVFMWYSFANGCFILPESLTDKDLRQIFNEDNSDIIYSVPLFYEVAANKVLDTAKKTNKEKSLARLLKFNTKIQTIFPRFGNWFVRNITAKSIRKKVFGKHVIALAIGGAKASKSTSYTLNGLGYRAVCGYGTTELGIFIAAYNCKIKDLNKGTVGNDPYEGKYKFDKDNKLSLCLPGCCDYVIQENKIKRLEPNAFIDTGDIGHIENGYLYIDAREDDLIVLPSGEKIYPNVIESYFEFLGPNNYRIVNYHNKLLLVVYFDSSRTKEDLLHTYSSIKEANKKIPISYRVQEIHMCFNPLPLSTKKEVSRIKLLDLMEKDMNSFPFMSKTDAKINNCGIIDDALINYIKKEVASVLSIDNLNTINDNDDFFADLGGDSLSFMELCSKLNESGELDPATVRALSLTSIKEIASQYKRTKERRGNQDDIQSN